MLMGWEPGRPRDIFALACKRFPPPKNPEMLNFSYFGQFVKIVDFSKSVSYLFSYFFV